MASAEQFQTLAKQNGWSAAFTNGYADGESTRKRQSSVPVFIRVARDEYAEGFRAGYFGRGSVRRAIQLRVA